MPEDLQRARIIVLRRQVVKHLALRSLLNRAVGLFLLGFALKLALDILR